MRSYLLRNLRFKVGPDYALEDEAAAKLRVPSSAFIIERIVRKALDTRRRDQPYYDFTLQLGFDAHPPANRDLAPLMPEENAKGEDILTSDPHPAIIGMGPAGLFCALAMVQRGLQSHLYDQGDPLEARAARVREFWQKGILDESSNVQFGEGGAGAFSDGKLTSRSKDPAIQQVFDAMISFGAPAGIAYEALPHLGTDGIRALVARIRDHLIANGCRFHYRSRLEDLEIHQGRVSRIRINGEWHDCGTVVLATGNAARPLFRILHEKGIALEPKAFAMGLRIEQPQARINRLVYGSERWAGLLGPASYRLTAKTGFTFCMCPGGQVIASSSQAGGIVTNGMSYALRNGGLCNSAVVTPVSSGDYGEGLWQGMELQQRLEQSCFLKKYLAPAQSAESFLAGGGPGGNLASSYQPGVYPAELARILPAFISDRLKSALLRFREILPGFDDGACLVAPETRTSSPIRILRDGTGLHSLSAENLYPIGEGSGYTGGIVSSAADGWRLGSRLRLGKKV